MIGISVTITKTSSTEKIDKEMNTLNYSPLCNSFGAKKILFPRLPKQENPKQKFYQDFRTKINMVNRIIRNHASAERNIKAQLDTIERVKSLKKMNNLHSNTLKKMNSDRVSIIKKANIKITSKIIIKSL